MRLDRLLVALLALAWPADGEADRIYLKSGGEVETVRWYYAGDMLYYQQYGGTVGVPRGDVHRIETKPSRPPTARPDITIEPSPVPTAAGAPGPPAVKPSLVAPSSIVGRWDSEARTAGGLGDWIEFRSDGTVLNSFGAMLDDESYRLEGDRLFRTRGKMPGQGSDLGQRIRFEKNAVIGARDTPMRRVGRSPGDGHSLAGIWGFLHHTGLTAYEEFTPDGRVLFRLPMQSQEGRYRLDGRTLTITWKDGMSATLDVRLGDDNLVTRPQGQAERRYRREQGSIPAVRAAAVRAAEVEGFRQQTQP
jgi:hypothetical protein